MVIEISTLQPLVQGLTESHAVLKFGKNVPVAILLIG